MQRFGVLSAEYRLQCQHCNTVNWSYQYIFSGAKVAVSAQHVNKAENNGKGKNGK
jgi:hypothetical protein